MHTSTVTVAVFPINDTGCSELDLREVEFFTTRGSGPGGQHRNTTDSVVTVRHVPTGLTAKAASKSQHDNKRTALRVLAARVKEAARSILVNRQNDVRCNQIGSGMRGDKIRTYRQQDDRATDHRNGARARLSDILEGKLEKLYD